MRVRSSSWYSSANSDGSKSRREALDEGCRQLELLRRDAHRLIERRERRLAHLVGPQQRLQHQHVAAHAQRGEPRLLAQREPHDRGAIGLLEGLAQQHVRLRRGGVGLEVVRLVEGQQVDLVARHELDDVDLAAALGRQRREVVLGEHDGAARRRRRPCRCPGTARSRRRSRTCAGSGCARRPCCAPGAATRRGPRSPSTP